MNPDIPKTPREELEARLTALLVGELPADEAFTLGRAIEQDAELAKLYTRLKETIGLVRETAATSVGQTAAQAQTLKLSETRREKLLERFKTLEPKEFIEAHERTNPWLVPLAALNLPRAPAGPRPRAAQSDRRPPHPAPPGRRTHLGS